MEIDCLLYWKFIMISQWLFAFLHTFLLFSLVAIAPLFETQCSYVEAKLAHFLSWTRGQPGTDVGPFSEFSPSEYWAYADYKYIAEVFQDQPSMFEVIRLLHVNLSHYTCETLWLWLSCSCCCVTIYLQALGFLSSDNAGRSLASGLLRLAHSMTTRSLMLRTNKLIPDMLHWMAAKSPWGLVKSIQVKLC